MGRGKVKKCEEVLAAQGEYPRYKEYCRLCTFFKTSFSRFVGNLTLPSLLESPDVFSFSAPSLATSATFATDAEMSSATPPCISSHREREELFTYAAGRW